MSNKPTRTFTLDALQSMRRQDEGGSDWRRFDQMSEHALDEAAAQEDQAFGFAPDAYDNAVVVFPPERPGAVEKESVTLRLDKDVLSYFRRTGKGYQTRINDALRLFFVRQLQQDNYHLLHEDDEWKLKREGAERAAKTFKTKAEAEHYSISHVKKQGGSLKIHRQDGTLQEERTYPRSADPERSPG